MNHQIEPHSALHQTDRQVEVSEPDPRSIVRRHLLSGLAASVIFMASCNKSARLKLNQPILQDVIGKVAHRYSFQSPAGQFIRVVVEQRGIEIVVRFIDPNGKELRKAHNPEGEYELESVSVITTISGEYQIEVSSLNETANGSYEVKLVALRPATPTDQTIIQADQAKGEAEELLTKSKGFDAKEQATEKQETEKQAIEKYEVALKLWTELDEKHEQAETYWRIGDIHYEQRKIHEAIRFFEQAVSLFPESLGRVNLFRDIGVGYYSLAETQKSLDAYNQAISAQAFAFASEKLKADILLYRAHTYVLTGSPQMDDYHKAIKIYDKLGNWTELALAYNYLGGAFRTRGTYQHSSGSTDQINDFQQAEHYYKKSLTMRQQHADNAGQAAARNNLGQLYDTQGKFLEAQEEYEIALRLVKPDNLRLTMALLSNIGFTYYKLEKFLDAKSSFNRALQINEKVSDQSYEAHLRYGIALIERKNNLRADALFHIEKTIGIVEHQRANLRSAENRLAYRVRMQQYYELYIDLLMRSGQKKKALEVSENSRVRVLLESLIEAQTKASNKNSYEFKKTPQISFGEIQKALGPKTILLEYALGEERSYLWAVTQKRIRSYELPNRSEIENLAKRSHEFLSRPVKEAGGNRLFAQEPVFSTQPGFEALVELSKKVLAQVKDTLGDKRLVIVADGALHYVPFGVLPDPNKGNRQPLIKSHEIVNLPSVSVLSVLRQRLAGRKPAPKFGKLFGDPVFSSNDDRMPKSRPTVNKKEQTLADLKNQMAVRLLEQTPNEPIKRLLYTRDEVEKIHALDAKFEKLLDFDASLEHVFNGELKQYRYVHFATHGLADAEHPEFSGILLSQFDRDGKPQQGFLYADQVYNLDLPAELVVLSACKTGIGKQVTGEGLISLTRGFMYSGAARVLVSLWNVDDEATAELMVRFYRNMLIGEKWTGKKLHPSAALRAAQREVMQQPGWESPYYWAAFTVQGEWR